MAKFPDMDEDVAGFNARSEERMQRWRRVFGTEDGKEVLIDLLGELHCLSTEAPTQEVIIRKNVGQWILSELGIMQPGQERALVDAYMGILPRATSASGRLF